MKLIEQYHEVLNIDSPLLIERAGRTCYKSEEKITEDSHNKFIKGLIARGHGAMLEHGNATVKLVTNRGVTHELVRHRLASFAQESTRYVNYKEGVEFIRPVWLPTDILGDYQHVINTPYAGVFNFISALIEAETAYKDLIEYNNWKPEEAREVLPNALKTEIVVTANFREWLHIFNLRVKSTTGRPHPQIKALLLPVLAEFAEKCPAVFKELYDSCLEVDNE